MSTRNAAGSPCRTHRPLQPANESTNSQRATGFVAVFMFCRWSMSSTSRVANCSAPCGWGAEFEEGSRRPGGERRRRSGAKTADRAGRRQTGDDSDRDRDLLVGAGPAEPPRRPVGTPYRRCLCCCCGGNTVDLPQWASFGAEEGAAWVVALPVSADRGPVPGAPDGALRRACSELDHRTTVAYDPPPPTGRRHPRPSPGPLSAGHLAVGVRPVARR